MNTFIKFLITVWLLLGFISCHSHEGNKKTSKQKFRSKVPISYLPAELDTLYSPLRQDTFILSEGHDEFRAPIEDLFSDEERRAHRTQILEYTWSMNKDSLLTVWYLPLQDSLKVLGKFSYPRDALF